MYQPQDPYWKLKPYGPAPEDELCHCEGDPDIVLIGDVGNNPIFCMECRGEVPPEQIGFSPELAEDLAFWNSFKNAFETLWLDSDEYEEWASAILSDPDSPVNQRAMEIRAKLDQHRSCFYWFFQDIDKDPFVPAPNCPFCHGPWEASGDISTCPKCKILIQSEVFP